MTRDLWLTRHPYLERVARLHAQVTAAAEVSEVRQSVLEWDTYLNDFHAGVPLLMSSSVALDLEPVESIVGALVERLAASALPDRLAQEMGALHMELHSDSKASRRAVAWLLYDETFATSCPGLLRYLGWTALARYLCPIVNAFGNWREEERWLRNYCPTCGTPPSMAQLVGTEPGRQRVLVCGCCGTRWGYRRSGCPFCENTDDRRLGVLAIEGDGDLRIDHCGSCGGYLKTYVGNGSEDVFLADWTSIHLDIIARDRQLKRLAASLYEL
jgi:FdhE protein